MTGIACLKVYGKTLMAGDSAAVDVNRHAISLAASPKVFQKDKCLIGYTSSFRMGYLLQHTLEIPPLRDDLDYWANIDFIDSVRDCLRKGGYLRKDSDVECAGQFLLAVKDEIYNIDNDLQANRQLTPYAACGSGAESILGSLYTSQFMEVSPKKRIILALEASADVNITVRAPFHVLELEHEN